MHLTKRERQILRLFCYKNKEIADILKISIATVKTHNQHIFKKLGEWTKPKALIKALKLGYENIFMIETDFVDVGFWDNKGKYNTDMQKNSKGD